MVDVSIVNFQPTDPNKKVLFVGSNPDIGTTLGISKAKVAVSQHSGVLEGFRLYLTAVCCPFEVGFLKTNTAIVMMQQMAMSFVAEAEAIGADHIVIDANELKEMEGWDVAIKAIQDMMKRIIATKTAHGSKNKDPFSLDPIQSLFENFESIFSGNSGFRPSQRR